MADGRDKSDVNPRIFLSLWYNKKCGRQVQPTCTVCPRRLLMTQVPHWAKMARTDHVTLRPWPLTLKVMAPVADAVVVLHVFTKFEVRGLAVRKTCSTMCVSINESDDLDFWPFDLETGVRVASKMGNLPSKCGHAKPLDSGIIRYVRDGRTDGRTDKSNAYCPFLTGGA